MRHKLDKCHIMTEKDMAILFEGFNKEFFDAKIWPPVKIRFVSQKEMHKITSHESADATWRPHAHEIWIDEIYRRSESICCLLLLHEMAHAVLESTYVGHPGRHRGHGMIFQAELYRLVRAGAYDGLL